MVVDSATPDGNSREEEPNKRSDRDLTSPRDPVLISAEVLGFWMAPDGHNASESVLSDPVVAEPGPQGEGFVDVEQRPDQGSLVILDVRWSAEQPGEGHEKYRQGHIPGAVFVSMSGQLSGHGAPSAGRHPLPEPARFTDAVRLLGINDNDTVVVYDDVSSTSAPRAWWLLRHAGFRQTYVLDGGLNAWRKLGLPLQAGEVLPIPGNAHTSWGKMPSVSTSDIEEVVEQGILIDARAKVRYLGEVEPIDPVAGHIPGARSAPVHEVLDSSGHFHNSETLREYFAGQGITSDSYVAVYCGSGVSASASVLALHIAGIDAALYPGSYSAWVNTANKPIATGEYDAEVQD